MKKISTFLLILLFSGSVFAQKQTVKIPLNATANNFKVIDKSSQNLTVKTSIAALYFSQKETQNGDFTLLETQGLIKTFDVGNPNLAVVSKLIEVPQDAEVVINIISYDEEIINLSDYGINNRIIPAQASISKSEDLNEVSFVINENVYNKDEFFANEIAIYEESGMLRATRLGRLQISPIQYNPVKNQIRVLNNLVVEILFVGANMQKTKDLKEKYASPYFDYMLERQIINYENNTSKELITKIPIEMAIVSDRMFESQLQPFIEWKELKGFNITVGYTDEVGSSAYTIKIWLQSLYEGDNPPSFVLFVGDVQQIPAWNCGDHVSDLRMCEYTGDNLPEVFYGRFSAQNTEQLQPQIDKTLLYEKYEMSDPSYLSQVFLVAGDDESWEDIWGNGAIWYADNYYCNSENGIYSHTFLQDPPMGNDAVSDSIIANMNAGLALANYTAHCGTSGWGKPSFRTSDIYDLENDEKYGLWIGNCCLSVKFDINECFGEAALRKANGGAIGDIGGSNSTMWDEDYWWGVGMGTPVEEPDYDDFGLGVYDGIFHTLANEQTDTLTWYLAQGQINVCGNLAVESSTSSIKQYYWEIYHLMGDPSLTNYLGVPKAITYTLTPTVLPQGATTADISTNAPYALIAFHQGDERIAVVMADKNGDASVTFSSAITDDADVVLVITAQNMQPLIEIIKDVTSTPSVIADKVQIYPNPTTNLLNIVIPNISENTQITLTDFFGRTIEQETINNNKFVIDFSNKAKGIYMLRISIGSEIITEKIIVE